MCDGDNSSCWFDADLNSSLDEATNIISLSWQEPVLNQRISYSRDVCSDVDDSFWVDEGISFVSSCSGVDDLGWCYVSALIPNLHGAPWQLCPETCGPVCGDEGVCTGGSNHGLECNVDGDCLEFVCGCIDDNGCNYDEENTSDPGSYCSCPEDDPNCSEAFYNAIECLAGDDQSNATWISGTCTYPETNYDCEGNCIEDVDCQGVCGGDAELDECGICGGP